MAASLVASLLVTAVVWAVSSIHSVRWRALVYSLPLPITAVLATTAVRVDGSQVLGVVLLTVFFAVVAVLHLRLGWRIAFADAAGIGVYTALSWLIAEFTPIPFLPTLVAVCALWAVATLVIGTGAASPAQPPPRPGALVKLGTVFGASLLMVALGRLLKGLVVTFPYSGVLVAVEARHHLGEFAQHFLRASIGLVAFFAGYYPLQDHGKPTALMAGWLAFVVCALMLHLSRAVTARRHAAALARNSNLTRCRG